MGNTNTTNSKEEATLYKLKKELEEKNRQLNELRKQNRNLIKQNISKDKSTKQYTVDDLVDMNYAAFTCIICQNSFDYRYRVPIMICKNQHTICQPCCKEMQSRKEKKCNECNLNFQNLGKNRSILQLITNKQDLLKWVKQRDAEAEQQARNAKLQSQLTQKTIVKLSRFRQYETMFEMNGDSLLKISPENTWHTIRSVDPLPKNSECEISFKVITSSCNSLIIGTTTQVQQFQKGFIPSYSVAYHLNNGHIYDQDSSKNFKWRSGGTSVAKNTNPRVLMTVNTIDNKIKWKVNNKVYAETQLPDKFLSEPLFAFVAVYHKDDMIVFNK